MKKLSGTIDGCGTAWVVRHVDAQKEIEKAFMAGAMSPYVAHFKLVKEAKLYANKPEKGDGV